MARIESTVDDPSVSRARRTLYGGVMRVGDFRRPITGAMAKELFAGKL